MTDTLTLELLGGVELRGVDSTAADRVLVQPKLVALLAYLAIAGAASRRYQRRDHLVGMFWPELDQAHARTALRKAVHLVRATLGSDTIVSRGDEDLALADGAFRCDAVDFVEHIEAGRLAAAMGLHRGDLMPGFHLGGCAEFGRWLDDQRNDLRERAGGAALALAQMYEKDSSYTVATRWARRAARYSWDDERVLRRALSLMDRAGDRSGALKLYDEFAERLKSELDAEPSPETAALIRQLRSV